MKLANIFGMHIGCKVMILPKNSPDSFQTQLLGVSTTGITIKNWQKNKIRVSANFEEFESIELILKPLSDITEDDIKGFEKVFRVGNDQKVANVRKSGVYVIVDVRSQGVVGNDFYEAFATPDEIDFLRSKGYDINVPEENKIVEGEDG